MFYIDGMGWVVNLTPHPIVLELDGQRTEIPRHGEPLRLSEEREAVGFLIDRVEYSIEKLPDPAWHDGGQVLYIVSNPVAQYAGSRGRRDFIAPDTSRGIRDGEGRVIAVRGFICF